MGISVPGIVVAIPVFIEGQFVNTVSLTCIHQAFFVLLLWLSAKEMPTNKSSLYLINNKHTLALLIMRH